MTSPAATIAALAGDEARRVEALQVLARRRADEGLRPLGDPPVRVVAVDGPREGDAGDRLGLVAPLQERRQELLADPLELLGGERRLRTTSERIARAGSRRSDGDVQPDGRSRPSPRRAERSAPRWSTASEISSAERPPAPRSSISAVRLARPGLPFGSAGDAGAQDHGDLDEGNLVGLDEEDGDRRWRARASGSARELERRRRPGRGRLRPVRRLRRATVEAAASRRTAADAPRGSAASSFRLRRGRPRGELRLARRDDAQEDAAVVGEVSPRRRLHVARVERQVARQVLVVEVGPPGGELVRVQTGRPLRRIRRPAPSRGRRTPRTG